MRGAGGEEMTETRSSSVVGRRVSCELAEGGGGELLFVLCYLSSSLNCQPRSLSRVCVSCVSSKRSEKLLCLPLPAKEGMRGLPLSVHFFLSLPSLPVQPALPEQLLPFHQPPKARQRSPS